MKTPEENIKFKEQNPDIKSQWIKITKELKEMSENWYKNAMHPNDKSTIQYLKTVDASKYPAIIIHKYRDSLKVIDGWHRLYASIQKGCKKIRAYVRIY